jgi:hypothetical protein
MAVIKIRKDTLMMARNALANALMQGANPNAVQADVDRLNQAMKQERPRLLPPEWTKIHLDDIGRARTALLTATTNSPNLAAIRASADFLSDHMGMARPFGETPMPEAATTETKTMDQAGHVEVDFDRPEPAVETFEVLPELAPPPKPIDELQLPSELKVGDDGYAVQEMARMKEQADANVEKQREKAKTESWPQFQARRLREKATREQISAEWKALKSERD